MNSVQIKFEINFENNVEPAHISEWVEFNLGIKKKIKARNPLKNVKMTTNYVQIQFRSNP